MLIGGRAAWRNIIDRSSGRGDSLSLTHTQSILGWAPRPCTVVRWCGGVAQLRRHRQQQVILLSRRRSRVRCLRFATPVARARTPARRSGTAARCPCAAVPHPPHPSGQERIFPLWRACCFCVQSSAVRRIRRAHAAADGTHHATTHTRALRRFSRSPSSLGSLLTGPPVVVVLFLFATRRHPRLAAAVSCPSVQQQ